MPRSPAFKEALREAPAVFQFSVAGLIEASEKDTPDTTSPSYDAQIDDVVFVRDVLGGTKALRKARTTYLSKHPGEDDNEYEDRVERAVLFNATKKTLGALAGMVFRKDPVLDGPDPVLDHAENIDLRGNDISTFARNTFTDALADGHTWIHVEFPKTEQADRVTRRAFNRSGKRPYWIGIKKADAINWRYEIRDGEPFLTLFVYREESQEPDGDFGTDIVTRYRVLRPGTFEVWEKQKNERNQAEWIRVEEGESGLPVVPVVWVPSRPQGIFASEPPMLDLAYENIEHYRVRSDHAHALHFASVPIPVLKGLETNDAGEVNVEWGPGRSILLPGTPDAEASILESSGAALDASREELQDIEGRMASLGLQMLVQQPQPNPQTATGELLDKAESDAELSVAARLLQNALGEALLLHEAWLAKTPMGDIPRGFEGEATIEINRDFRAALMSAQQVQVLSTLVQTGQLSLETMWQVLVSGEWLPEDFDPEQELMRMGLEIERELGGTPMAQTEEPGPLDEAA